MTRTKRGGRVLVTLLALFGLLAPLAAILAFVALSLRPAESAFPGANGKIVFASDREGGDPVPSKLFLMNPDGTDQTRLTNTSEGDPAWSPDGTKVAFWSTLDGGVWDPEKDLYPFEIYVVNADGTGLTRLTNNQKPDFGPTWSPDGSQIAFFTNRAGDYEIYVMNADGTGQTNLTNDPENDVRPAWSPNGDKIAFGSNRGPLGMYVYVINADGTEQTWLAAGSSPHWSPDGTKIAFTSDRDGNNEVYVMNADGTGQSNLTNDPANDSDPAWSPDGTKIAFTSDRDGNNEVYVMNADGTGQSNLTNSPADDFASGGPDWQPLVGAACGDVDCDDDVDAVDALFILQCVVGLRSASDQCPPPEGHLYLSAGDVDCDDDVDAVDALFVLQHVVGLRPELCVCPTP